jgi:hypothetical protein
LFAHHPTKYYIYLLYLGILKGLAEISIIIFTCQIIEIATFLIIKKLSNNEGEYSINNLDHDTHGALWRGK